MKSNKFLFIIILLIGCLGQIASDIYTPSVPAIAKAMSAPLHHVQWTMTAYLYGLALSMLVYGPMSERFGRKPPILVGLTLFISGTLLSLVSHHIGVLILGRLIQGLGAGASSCLWRSIFRDSFEGAALAKYASYLTMAVTFIIPASPMLGGYLQHYIGWRASFGFMLIYALISILIVSRSFKETIKQKKSYQLKHVGPTYIKLIKHRVFIGNTIAVFLTYGAFFSWFIVSPVLIIHKMGYSPIQYGWINFVLGAVGIFFAGHLNAKFSPQLGASRMMKIGWSLMILSGIAMLAMAFFIRLHIGALSAIALVFFFGVGLIWPNAFATAFKPVGDMAGFASALYSFMQILGGAVWGSIIALLPNNSAYPLGICIAVIGGLAWVSYCIIANPKHMSSHDHASTG